MVRPSFSLPAPGLTVDHVRYAMAHDIHQRWEVLDGAWTAVFEAMPSADQVATVSAFIANPTALTVVDPSVKKLTDTYLTVKACYDAIPDAPPTGEDSWASARTRCKAELDAAYAAMVDVGGPG